MVKKLIFLIFVFGLIYVISPGPATIDDFPPIPDSLKSDEPEDTVKIPNVAAYYSELKRNEITKFYLDAYKKLFIFGFIPPVSLNFPPQDTSKHIRSYYISTTFLEEYVYPLRGSIFVNGYEPYIESELLGKPHGPLGDRMGINGKFFWSKATIRYYPNEWYFRILVYFGVWTFGLILYKFVKKLNTYGI